MMIHPMEFVVLRAVYLCNGVGDINGCEDLDGAVNRHLVEFWEFFLNIMSAENSFMVGKKIGDALSGRCEFVPCLLQFFDNPVILHSESMNLY